MTDTSPQISTRLAALFAARSPSDRVIMACEMFDLARALVVSSVKAGSPGLSDTGLRVVLFERLYGGDFEPEVRARIVARLRRPRGLNDIPG